MLNLPAIFSLSTLWRLWLPKVKHAKVPLVRLPYETIGLNVVEFARIPFALGILANPTTPE
jgi:hypothetical protein